ncbi:hypothetical protein BDZ94DRAFT_797705 [Collybia nuda]|uniref:Uncharacterized protein n=1 Tax=Collybia nuda TaxID=64659 RepID=A0A9P5Y5K0_9AGAR|nr:hypothetical protein BDZ94DRAFT_797705 [Collybia nuda]
MISSAVPKEIIDTIIEELYGCNEALEACSLVSRSFLDASRRIFLSQRAISIKPTAQSIDQLVSFIRSPTNSCYIYDVRIHYQHCDNDWWATTLPSMLALLDNLHSISICEYGADGKIDWNNVPPIVQASLLTTFRLPGLINIRFYGVENFPAAHFSYMTQLKALVCVDCKFNFEKDFLLSENPEPLVGRGYLESLLVYNPHSSSSLSALLKVFEHPKSGLHISQLRSLLVYGRASDLTDATRKVTKASSGSLETFTWWLESPQPESGPMSSPSAVIDLKITQNLHTIYLTTDYPDVPEHDALLWLITALASPSGLRKLKELTIFVRAPIEEPETLIINNEIWTGLNWALTLPNRSEIQRVRIIFSNRPCGRDVRFVSESMPDLHDNGVLEVGSGMNELWSRYLEVYKWKGGSRSSFVPIS